MTTEDQINFITDHCECVAKKCRDALRAGRVPPHFDGHELRVWLNSQFRDSARMSELRRHPHGKRNKDFVNWQQTTPGV